MQPINEQDYTYDESHYGYILSMMKKFDLCYTPDDKVLLIPSAFGKEPKVEYNQFKGETVRTYILQFKDYMPLALIHKFIAKRLPEAYEDNFWYSGIVVRDNKNQSLTMVHADKEAKRIYIRIKGTTQLGTWEHIRRELYGTVANYAKIVYHELVALDEKSENTVDYEDLVSHVKSNKTIYFHPRLQKDFNVGYLIGLFESQETTISKFQNGELVVKEAHSDVPEKVPNFVINILNNNSPQVNTNVNTHIDIDINLQLVHNVGSELKGDALYLLEELRDSNDNLTDALKRILEFADDAKSSQSIGDLKEKGWSRKLKSILQVLGNAGEQLKNIRDGSEALKSVLNSIQKLASHFSLNDVLEIVKKIIPTL